MAKLPKKKAPAAKKRSPSRAAKTSKKSAGARKTAKVIKKAVKTRKPSATKSIKRIVAPKKRASLPRKKKVTAVLTATLVVDRIAESQSAPEGPREAFRDQRIPDLYQEDRMALLVRDPWWLFCYWEVTETHRQRVMQALIEQGFRPEKTVLRVYDITGRAVETANHFFDIELNFLTHSWYIDAGIPARDWVVEIGIRTHEGRFFPLLRSNAVKTPPFGISEVLDEEWMLPDELFFKLFGSLAGSGSRGDSMDIRKILEKNLKQTVSSESSPKFTKSGG